MIFRLNLEKGVYENRLFVLRRCHSEIMLQYLAIAMPTKKCEEDYTCSESVDLKKNVRRLRFSCFKKPGIPKSAISFTEQQQQNLRRTLVQKFR